jgi:hypothetical protein
VRALQDDGLIDLLRMATAPGSATQNLVEKLAAGYGIDMQSLSAELKKTEAMTKEEKTRYVMELKNSLPMEQRASLDKAISMLRAFMGR